jgi:hypothetical protein
LFFPADSTSRPPGEPFEIKLPHGRLTWAIAREPGTTVLWITQKGLVRKINFTDPTHVQETQFEDGGIVNVPEQFRDAFSKAFEVRGAPVQQQESLKPEDDARPGCQNEHGSAPIDVNPPQSLTYARRLPGIIRLRTAGPGIGKHRVSLTGQASSRVEQTMTGIHSDARRR